MPKISRGNFHQPFSKMKTQPLIAAALFGQPWSITPDAYENLAGLYRAYLQGNLPMAPDHAPEERDEETTAPWVLLPNGVGVIGVGGVMVKHAVRDICGPQLTAYSDLDRSLMTLAEKGARQIFLNFNTPGGQSIGLVESAARIEAIRAAGIEVYAYTDELCCSAGYWLASACSEVWAAPSAYVGSIGVYIAGLDSSKQFEQEGLELKLFKSGELKALGHPGKKWTPEEEAHLAQQVSALGAAFRSHVMARRPRVSASEMQGQAIMAAEAVGSLVDGLAIDFETFVASRS